MHLEIERKFLVRNNRWKQAGQGIDYKQGYLLTGPSSTVRVRIAEDDCKINIKGGSQEDFRLEFEYPIPRKDALIILHTLCIKPLISKTRYRIWQGELCWEIDEFHEDNEGLVIAEIELAYPEQEFERPGWLGREVTADARFYNASLVSNPYTSWP